MTPFSPVQVWASAAYHNSVGRMHQCSQLIEIILSLGHNKGRSMQRRDTEGEMVSSAVSTHAQDGGKKNCHQDVTGEKGLQQ